MKRKKFATETEPSPQQTQQITEIANSYILTKKKKKKKTNPNTEQLANH